MKLPKEIRKWLFAGDVVELEYPNALERYAPTLEAENPPFQTGNSYSFRSGGGSVAKCRVLRQVRAHHGWTVVIAHDIQNPPRLLARAGANYTKSPSRALRGIPGGEPEAVDKVTLDRLARETEEAKAARREEEKLRREKRSLEARLSIGRKVAEIRGVDISRDTRVIKERVERIEKALFEDRGFEEAA